ncbi:FAD/NAD(P)-binding domain-containing protein [Schizopora paradoxa]|uniref:FAD/NAD(P)-binding domain-containing protein n=1 Tax=Schizopora paradoxa TaxID=27342 RepID=A0A0H2RAI6_9AGAM|nr:FAD/NAD(P)-binding domain-containing protein [Schizopora paradoxa]
MIAPNITSPILRDLFHRTAKLRLHFLVLGANIAGLSCAYHLRQAGHEVTIIEPRALALENKPIALCMPPNMTRPLLRCGLGPQLQKYARKCTFMSYASGSSLEVLADMHFPDDLMEDLDADIMIINYNHLMEMLYNLAIDSGVKVEFGKIIMDVDAEGPSVTLFDGSVIHGDVIVGVYGESSLVRPLLEKDLDTEEEEGEENDYFAVVLFSVKTSDIDDDEFRNSLLNDGNPKWHVFTGNQWSINTLPKDDGLEVFVHLFLDEKTFMPRISESTQCPLKDIVLDDIHPNLQKLINHAENVSYKRHVSRPRLADWHDDPGHLVVIGEAAYILNPGSDHAPALAIGDAAVLGTLFSHIHHREQIPRLLAAFQELRQDRCENVGKWELGFIKSSSLPPGPERDARDAELNHAIRATAQGEEQETYLEKEWGEFWRVFQYDPYEAADEWWVEWGVIPDRMDGWNDTIAHLCVEVKDECNLTDSD